MAAGSKKRTRADQLIDRAIELFSQGGYRETSLQEIADQLGITRPLFYYYFASKEDLLWRIISNLGDDLLARARPIALSAAEPDEKLRQLLRAHAETVLGNAAAFKIYFAERHLVTGSRHEEMKQGEDAYMALMTQVVAQAQSTGLVRPHSPQLLALLVTGMADSMLRWFVPGGTRTITEMTDMFVNAAIAAVAGPAPRTSVGVNGLTGQVPEGQRRAEG